MNGFSDEVLQAAGSLREVDLVTTGRKTGKPQSVIIWIWGDGQRLFIRSGGGLDRQWPQNILADSHALIRLGDLEVPVIAQHITDVAQARSLAPLAKQKYGPTAGGTPGTDDSPTPGEQATFELLPA